MQARLYIAAVLIFAIAIVSSCYGQDIDRALPQNADENIQMLKELLTDLEQQNSDARNQSLEEYLGKNQKLRQRLSHWYGNLSQQFKAPPSILNYIYFNNAVTPRLSGREIQVGPNSQFQNLADALLHSKAGDTILLEAGAISVGTMARAREKMLIDIEIRGHPNGTRIINNDELDFRNFATSRRVQFTNIEFDGNDDEIGLGRSSLFRFRNCRFTNYNSGAGGSNALYGVDVLLLIEDCSFEGEDGSAKGHSFGNAFDFRGNDYVYLRNTKFILNSEIGRSVDFVVFDNCKAISQKEGWAKNSIYATTALIRDSDVPIKNAKEFKHSVDDVDFFRFLSDDTENAGDEKSAFGQLLQRYQSIDLRNNPRYWIGMMKSADDSIRRAAAKRVEKLLGRKMDLPNQVETSESDEKMIKKYIDQLNDKSHAVRENASDQLRTIGKSAVVHLENAKDSGSIEQRARIEEILTSFSANPDTQFTSEAGRMLSWFEENQTGIIYDPKSDAFQKKK